MSKYQVDCEHITAIRGATTSNGNLSKEIENSVVELIDELIGEPDDIHLTDLYSSFSVELHHFKQISRACFWGSCA